MLVATSLIYVLFYGTSTVLIIVFRCTRKSAFSRATWADMYKSINITKALWYYVYAYNFFVYLITGKRFRSELRRLYEFCRPSAADDGTLVTHAHAHADTHV